MSLECSTCERDVRGGCDCRQRCDQQTMTTINVDSTGEVLYLDWSVPRICSHAEGHSGPHEFIRENR